MNFQKFLEHKFSEYIKLSYCIGEFFCYKIKGKIWFLYAQILSLCKYKTMLIWQATTLSK
jgi:hypothetical protein